MDQVLLIAGIAVFLLVLTVLGSMRSRREKKEALERIRKSFGALPAPYKEDYASRFRRVSGYFRSGAGETEGRGLIDDITWEECIGKAKTVTSS